MIAALWGAIGGFLASYLLQYLGELAARRRFSLLGASIVRFLTDQVALGINMLEQIAAGQSPQGELPKSAWSGSDTLPKEVLLRIVSLDQGLHEPHPDVFRPHDILTHCNNYFVYICGNVNTLLRQTIPAQAPQGQPQPILISSAALQAQAKEYLDSARKVKAMLERTRGMLEHNARVTRPS